MTLELNTTMPLVNAVQTHLLLTKIVWKVGNHDLRLAWNSIFWRTTLLSRLGCVGFACLVKGHTFFAFLRCERLVGSRGKWCSLPWDVGRPGAVSGGLSGLAIGLSLAALNSC